MGISTYLLLSTIYISMVLGSIDKVSHANNLFALPMYQELAKQPGNVFFSPMSAHALLSLVSQGATGKVLDELNKVLGVNQRTSADGYQHLMQSLNHVKDITLHIANKMYIPEKAKLKKTFKAVAKGKFFAEAESINFSDKNAVQKINQWCAQKTNNKIKDMLKPGDVDGLTAMVLLNAIYFKGDWHYQFNKTNTQRRPFHRNEYESVDVDMMFRRANFNYGINKELDAKILEMKYKNNDTSMVIILPKDRKGIDKLEMKLKTFDLSTLTRGMRVDEVEVSLPKFKFDTTTDLGSVLKKMGLVLPFTFADFAQLIDSPMSLVISKATQKAFIEINEEGSEAAAASSLTITPIMAGLRFRADHPFIFVIQVKTGNVRNTLFLGRFSHPGRIY